MAVYDHHSHNMESIPSGGVGDQGGEGAGHGRNRVARRSGAADGALVCCGAVRGRVLTTERRGEKFPAWSPGGRPRSGSVRLTSASPRSRPRITRGSGPSRAAMLCGVPSARRGSKRRGIHSHSWTKRKNVPDRGEVPGLGRCTCLPTPFSHSCPGGSVGGVPVADEEPGEQCGQCVGDTDSEEVGGGPVVDRVPPSTAGLWRTPNASAAHRSSGAAASGGWSPVPARSVAKGEQFLLAVRSSGPKAMDEAVGRAREAPSRPALTPLHACRSGQEAPSLRNRALPDAAADFPVGWHRLLGRYPLLGNTRAPLAL